MMRCGGARVDVATADKCARHTAHGRCIIVGNPMLMLAKPHWKSLLQRCITRHAYAGCPAPLRPLAASSLDVQDEFDEDAEMEALSHLMQEHMLALGAGRGPQQSAQVLENFFRDEQEFRVLM